MTESDLLLAIQARYPAPEFAFLPQVRNCTGHQRRTIRTADALALGLYPSRGIHLHGFEVKSYRSDWVRELKNPEKADSIARFCDFWWVVAEDETVVPKSEVPTDWGLLVMVNGRLTQRKEAAYRSADPLDKPMLAAILRKAAECVVPLGDIEKTIQQRMSKERERWRDNLHYDVQRLEKHNAALTARIDGFEKAAGIRITDWDAGNLGNAVAAVRTLLYDGSDGLGILKRSAERLRDLATRAGEAVAEMEAIQKSNLGQGETHGTNTDAGAGN